MLITVRFLLQYYQSFYPVFVTTDKWPPALRLQILKLDRVDNNWEEIMYLFLWKCQVLFTQVPPTLPVNHSVTSI